MYVPTSRSVFLEVDAGLGRDGLAGPAAAAAPAEQLLEEAPPGHGRGGLEEDEEAQQEQAAAAHRGGRRRHGPAGRQTAADLWFGLDRWCGVGQSIN